MNAVKRTARKRFILQSLEGALMAPPTPKGEIRPNARGLEIWDVVESTYGPNLYLKRRMAWYGR